MDQTIKKKLARNWFKTLQEVICQEIEELEAKKNIFKIKNWERGKNSNEGGGQFRILENGKIFEKVGVNFSEVYGKFSNKFKNRIPGAEKNPKFWASGISVVIMCVGVSACPGCTSHLFKYTCTSFTCSTFFPRVSSSTMSYGSSWCFTRARLRQRT